MAELSSSPSVALMSCKNSRAISSLYNFKSVELLLMLVAILYFLVSFSKLLFAFLYNVSREFNPQHLGELVQKGKVVIVCLCQLSLILLHYLCTVLIVSVGVRKAGET